MGLNLNQVLAFATEKHLGVFRKDKVTPYIEHPKLAAKIVEKFVKNFGRKEDLENLPLLIAAAYLHDIIEDTHVSYLELKERFGDTVSGLVMDVSTVDYEKNEKGKDHYLAEKLTAVSDYAVVIKLADRMANVLDSEALTLEEKFKLRKGTENILKFVQDVRGAYFSTLITEMFDAIWATLNTKIPYSIFVGTKFEDKVFKETSYLNPNFEIWQEKSFM